jgi:hypothetical protein
MLTLPVILKLKVGEEKIKNFENTVERERNFYLGIK